MTKKTNQNLTLDRPLIYQIKVPGELDEKWSRWIEMMTVTVGNDNDDLPITTNYPYLWHL